jgi:hypothetical protein
MSRLGSHRTLPGYRLWADHTPLLIALVVWGTHRSGTERACSFHPKPDLAGAKGLGRRCSPARRLGERMVPVTENHKTRYKANTHAPLPISVRA